MFFAANSNTKDVQRILAKQRAKEIATTGYSKIKVAKAPKRMGKVIVINDAKHNESTELLDDITSSSYTASGEFKTIEASLSESFSKTYITESSRTLSSDDARKEITSSYSDMGYDAKVQFHKGNALAKIDEQMEQVRNEVLALKPKIKQLFELSKARLNDGYDEKIVALGYRRAKSLAYEKNGKENIVKGLAALKTNVKGGYVKPEKIEVAIKEVLDQYRERQLKKSSDAQLVLELKGKIYEEEQKRKAKSEASTKPVQEVEVGDSPKKRGSMGLSRMFRAKSNDE